MPKSLLSICLSLLSLCSFGQSFNADKVELANYIKRMYRAAPFEGVRVVDDYDNCYLITVLSLENDKYKNKTVMNRVASVKAMSEAAKFINGAEVSTTIIMRTKKGEGKKNSDADIIENIIEHSSGYVKQLELLTSFQEDKDSTVFVFCTRMETNS